MAEADLDSAIKPWHSGSTKHSILKEIAIVCAAGLTRPNIPLRTQKDIERALRLAEEALQHG